jgi:hypothetical protein
MSALLGEGYLRVARLGRPASLSLWVVLRDGGFPRVEGPLDPGTGPAGGHCATRRAPTYSSMSNTFGSAGTRISCTSMGRSARARRSVIRSYTPGQ